MAARRYLNNYSTKLTAAITNSATTVNVTAGDGAILAAAATFGSGDWIIGTLRKRSGYADVAREIVKITARSTDALTITRAQEGTTGLAFSEGDTLDVDITAGSLSPIEDSWTAYTPTITAATGTFTSVAGAGRYKQLGRTVIGQVSASITTAGTAGGAIYVPLPINAKNASVVAFAQETVATGGIVCGSSVAGTLDFLVVVKYDATTIIASGRTVIINFAYEVA